MIIAEAERTAPDPPSPRVLIICENASLRFGGEASLPLHYFSRLRRRGIEAWLITHGRTREEISDACAQDLERISFVSDTAINRLCWRIESRIPSTISHFTVGFISRVATQLEARRMARAVIRRHGVTIVHQPIPVSPREPSFIHDMGCPVVIGPMNGNMTYPRAFWPGGARSTVKTVLLRLVRSLSRLAHVAIPGKPKSAALIYANERTRAALPVGGYRGELIAMHENAVDLSLWQFNGCESAMPGIRFVCMARLVDWKAIDIAISALGRMKDRTAVTLEIIGSGPEEQALRKLVTDLGLDDRVIFSGWLAQSECAERLRSADALFLPSLRECGGAVVLEAMACGIPVVATEWGGPADYLDATCGVLVPPTSRPAMIEGFATAMSRLAADPDLRQRLGRAARQRVVDHFDWEKRIDAMLSVYQRHQAAVRTR